MAKKKQKSAKFHLNIPRAYQLPLIILLLFLCAAISVPFLRGDKVGRKDMERLRAIYEELNFPTPRSSPWIRNYGKRTDLIKGSVHYTRNIQLEYETAGPVESYMEQLPGAGWEQQGKPYTIMDTTSYEFVHFGKRVCLAISMDSVRSSLAPYRMTLYSPMDDHCSHYFD